MEKNILSNYFEGVVAKYLSAVDTSPKKSNQHEFNIPHSFAPIIGRPGSDKIKIKAKFIFLSSDEDDFASFDDVVTWYDARANNPNRAPEYRLYYRSNSITNKMSETDFCVIGKKPCGDLCIVIAHPGSTEEQQIRWLFDITHVGRKFELINIEPKKSRELGFSERYILDELGIEVKDDDIWLDKILSEFGKYFPPTKDFSKFARSTSYISCKDDPDHALVSWMSREEVLFKTLEKHVISDQIKKGFDSVETFIKLSLSVQNRRKSRVGHALENHLEEVFTVHGLRYSRGKNTELRKKPDFIFPSIEDYHNPIFPEANLVMLGSKSTCKDRWRQVLTEAKRINKKHLLTLQPAISENQTEEMALECLQLVVPSQIQSSYKKNQQKWLLSLEDFIQFAQTKTSINY